jgi:hypothetical protein
MKTKLFVSFSGGKSSGYMAKRLVDEWSDYFEFLFLFANTGEEREETLIFIKECEEHWKLNIVWVEAVVHHGVRKASTHRVVDFHTASRNGEPFEEVIRKYGIPNVSFPHCTRELKLCPMYSYVTSIGWEKGTYRTAIGIRNDEQGRLREDAEEAGIIYPLAHLFPVDKADVNDWWDDQPFTLQLNDYEGNCAWCWKKSTPKHFRLIDEVPHIYGFPARMEHEYPTAGTNPPGAGPRTFFRRRLSTVDLFTTRFAMGPTLPPLIERPDEHGGCSESCDINMEIGTPLIDR